MPSKQAAAAPRAAALLASLIFLIGSVAASRTPQGLLGTTEAAPARRLTAAVGESSLQEVTSPLPYPFSALGLLVFEREDAAAGGPGESADVAGRNLEGTAVCTGFLVSEDTVVTAAHCVYDEATSVAAGDKEDRPGRFRRVLGFLPSYARSPDGTSSKPLGRIDAVWTDVAPEFKEWGAKGRTYWRGDIGVVRLAKKVGQQTGWFGLADHCAVASAALQAGAVAKERAGGAASSLAPMSVAGFPGSAAVASKGKLYFPLMGDQQCRASSAQLCPADSNAPAEERTGGMMRHQCDTGKGMSGAPLWLADGSRASGRAAALAAAAGAPGSRGGGLQPKAVFDADGETSGTHPVVAVGVVSRASGNCPWGADCINLAAPINAAQIAMIKAWIARP